MKTYSGLNFSSYMTPEEVMEMQANGKGLKGVPTSELKALMVIKVELKTQKCIF